MKPLLCLHRLIARIVLSLSLIAATTAAQAQPGRFEPDIKQKELLDEITKGYSPKDGAQRALYFLEMLGAFDKLEPDVKELMLAIEKAPVRGGMFERLNQFRDLAATLDAVGRADQVVWVNVIVLKVLQIGGVTNTPYIFMQHFVLGSAYLRVQNFGDATNQFRIALAIQMDIAKVLAFEKMKHLVSEEHTAKVKYKLAGALMGSGEFKSAALELKDSIPMLLRSGSSSSKMATHALELLGECQYRLGDFASAIKTFQTSLKRHDNPESAVGNGAISRGGLGSVLLASGDLEASYPYLKEALDSQLRDHDRKSTFVAVALTNLAVWHGKNGDTDKQLELHAESLQIREAVFPPNDIAIAEGLNNAATSRAESGDFAAVISQMQRSLRIVEDNFGQSHPLGAHVSVNLAFLHLYLGQDVEAEEALSRSSMFATQMERTDTVNASRVLAGLAVIRSGQRRFEEAIRLSDKCVDLLKPGGEQYEMSIAACLAVRGNVLLEADKPAEALQTLQESRQIFERARVFTVPERVVVLVGIADTMVSAKRSAEAQAVLEQGLQVAVGASGVRLVMWRLYEALFRLHRDQSRPDFAIFFGKQAVNELQRLRQGVQSLDQLLQTRFLQERQWAYEDLADLLIKEGRIGEATQVLQMMKEQELYEGLERANNTDSRTTKMGLTGLESEKFAPYFELRDRLASLGAERQVLERKAQQGALSASESARLKEITEKLMRPAQEAVTTFMRQVEKDFAATPDAKRFDKRPEVATEATHLREAVDKLEISERDAKAVALQYVVTTDRLSILLTLPGAPTIPYQLPVGREQLGRKLVDVNVALKAPTSDVPMMRADLRQLYDWLIPPEVEADLKKFGAKTLMLSLDDGLRTVPFAAFISPQNRYLVQDYTLAIYNEASKQALTKSSAPAWRIAAMGLSDAVKNSTDDLPALPAVDKEITAIVSSTGKGSDSYLNGKFSRPQLDAAMGNPGSGKYNVLHVASHFVFSDMGGGQSRLYLGDQSQLTLADIARQKLRFDNFDLVTLSACQTAVSTWHRKPGQEIESLGAKVQLNGAQAVVATLWKVYDPSTGVLMQRFYENNGNGKPRLNKAQALQAAQLSMLEKRDSAWSHPYYWAPFVLMGNWR